MKNLFGVLKKSEQVDSNGYIIRSANAFIDRTADSALLEKQKQMRLELARVEKFARPPKWLGFLGMFFVVAAIVFLFTFCALWKNQTFAELNRGYPWLLPVTIVSVAACAAFLIYTTVRAKRVMNSSETKFILERAENITSESYAALGVPADAVNVDVFAPVLTERLAQKPDYRRSAYMYQNLEKKAFREDDALCLAEIGCVVKIPLERITRIYAVNKYIRIQKWNKDEPCRKGRYRQYKISTNNNMISVKPYYIVELRDGAEEYEFIVPCYDIDAILRLTGKAVG